MLKAVLAGLVAYFLIGPSIIYAATPDLCRLSMRGTVSVVQSELIKARMAQVDSVASLAEVLAQIGDVDESQSNALVKLSRSIIKDFGIAGARKIAHSLMLNHPYLSRNAVRASLTDVIYKQATSGKQIQKNFYAPVTEDRFLKWVKLGETINTNQDFRGQLEVAVGDFKTFEFVYGHQIDVDNSRQEILAGLQRLDRSSLVGQFIETFLNLDRLTRQYMIDQLVSLSPPGEESQGDPINLTLRGAVIDPFDSAPANHQAAFEKMLFELLAKSPDEIQEDAFFHYRSNGYARRPEVKDPVVMRNVALRYVTRMNFELNDLDVNYAVQFLLQYPIIDVEIDTTIQKIVEVGQKPKRIEISAFDEQFALFELKVLERNAQQLGASHVDFRHVQIVLGRSTRNTDLLKALADLHRKYDLRKFPELASIVRQNLQTFGIPENHFFTASQRENLEKLNQDLSR